jgi:hypothetical protein
VHLKVEDQGKVTSNLELPSQLMYQEPKYNKDNFETIRSKKNSVRQSENMYSTKERKLKVEKQ